MDGVFCLRKGYNIVLVSQLVPLQVSLVPTNTKDAPVPTMTTHNDRLLLIVGFLVGRKGLLTHECLKVLSDLSYYVFSPCLLFDVMLKSLTLQVRMYSPHDT